jgi:hypothetical protein
MKIKHVTVIFVFLNCFVLTINAQDARQNICSALKKTNLAFSADKILIIGEVFKSQMIKLNKFPHTLSQSIAMVGGFSRKAYIEKIQIIQCSSDFSSVENTTLLNFRKIKDGSENDIELKGGEIIYIPKTKNSGLSPHYNALGNSL